MTFQLMSLKNNALNPYNCVMEDYDRMEEETVKNMNPVSFH